MGEYVLEMNHICKSFPGVKALDDVSLKVRPGSVHALVGENGAGKSTLMKCLFGIYIKDSGDIILNGKNEEITSTKQALNLGISMIHQELHPIRFRPVMENIWLGRFPKKGIMVDRRGMIRRTRELFQTIDLDINPETQAGDLSPSTLQLVEIAKAVSYRAKIIIMDEPTSSLTDNETEHLFKIIRQLQQHGCAIIYISHKMEEILKICDEVTIMRDGKLIGSWQASEMTTETMINKMVGRELTDRFPKKDYTPGKEVVLQVKDLCSAAPRSFRHISFELHKGEILGIGGLVGAQRTELVESIFGLREIASGEIVKDGGKIEIRRVEDAKRNGFALLTEERRASGVFAHLSVLDNTVIASQRRYARHGALSNTLRVRAAEKMDGELHVKTPSLGTEMENLSGGNQQKVLIARWLLTRPDILILDEPTRGIDVGAKYEIYTIMLQLIRQGKSIIMISSEMPELLGMADRIMVMCEGRLTGILDRGEANQVSIMRLATKYMN
ncbi:MAG: sugar ABC transporter ATP-binding protein [Oscillospiraceae bacterium]|jgi:methyl-galactoside transport system ATP-binding protein|nr:sugar ABC transporter ATP-binding protein [Oscillospiraceae bacterium]MCI1990183.1 sugar ABC transporter ATP-binding protein [Oscillospiraceae bacterium]MCI2034860.1 sugar ABC transporter ATP-binding protein [Oscillospiraceae bacterium]